MNKYICIEIRGIITQIVVKMGYKNYTESVLLVSLPNEDELTEIELRDWIEKSNNRMIQICNFMNQSGL